ncbi:hypothetical protein CRENPOLYSF2_760004 [Crenothrix polyspora]|uniref:Potassium channel domain-containing protein n=1 Tax=Crenothrix polyspora TaxID=360316 RepID=A0A1R4HIK0_9GAMM|nr:ion channel [Crenothrix polyspora]SJM95831.1 hypothetical protein CRENPOLYSF2_760004 [Crenothrix polyspora]
MEAFITASENITDTSSLEWQYYANLSKDDIVSRWKTPNGESLLKNLQAAHFSRTALEQYIGKFNHKFDLRGIKLAKHDLSSLDLSDVDFFAADLSNVVFKNSILSNSFLSECNVCGAIFDWAKLDGALLDNVIFDNKTRFLGVNIREVNFTLATLVYDLALSQQRIQQLEQHYKIFSWFLRVTCDYGRSFLRYLFWVVGFIVGYAAIYTYLMAHPFFDCLYFSVVTFATVGYGDILPVTPVEKFFVITEILIGYIMGGLLVAILAKRVIG